MFSFSTDYFLFVFVSAVGVIQISACLGDLRGLMLLRSKLLTWAFGLILPVSAAIWFFSTETRNINDYDGGLDANEQALFFSLGAVSALGASLLLSSVVNVRMKGEDGVKGAGFESLKSASYARAAARSLRHWWLDWRT